ncbi:hypothetical protein DFJ73DRAFT_152228 [Zopfochytrium polystomum]|nr:hypothetical protein DFJ73DRAFT_152228 [Zopfochytrium polystomum]
MEAQATYSSGHYRQPSGGGIVSRLQHYQSLCRPILKRSCCFHLISNRNNRSLGNIWFYRVAEYGDERMLFVVQAGGFTLCIFDLVIETSFFILGQYKIVSSLGRRSLPRHITRVVIRCICFTTALLLQYFALFGYISPGNGATSLFLYQGPSLMLLVLLSDSLLIRDIVEQCTEKATMPTGISTSRIG